MKTDQQEHRTPVSESTPDNLPDRLMHFHRIGKDRPLALIAAPLVEAAEHIIDLRKQVDEMRLGRAQEALLAKNEEIEQLRRQLADLHVAVFDLVNMERIQTPDMSGKRRTFAYMRNGTVLADCLDRARALLPYDMQPTDPHHGGKIPPE